MTIKSIPEKKQMNIDKEAVDIGTGTMSPIGLETQKELG